jgi:hypothetical protein
MNIDCKLPETASWVMWFITLLLGLYAVYRHGIEDSFYSHNYVTYTLHTILVG